MFLLPATVKLLIRWRLEKMFSRELFISFQIVLVACSFAHFYEKDTKNFNTTIPVFTPLWDLWDPTAEGFHSSRSGVDSSIFVSKSTTKDFGWQQYWEGFKAHHPLSYHFQYYYTKARMDSKWSIDRHLKLSFDHLPSMGLGAWLLTWLGCWVGGYQACI